MSYTDIKRQGWIKRLPADWQPYVVLMRLDRPIGWWLLLLPGWWGIILGTGGLSNVNGHTAYLMLLFFIGAILMRGAGCVINDLWDRDLDKKVERTQTRPLASGEITIRQALYFLSTLLGVSFLILIQMSMLTIYLGLFSMLLVTTYPLMKRFTWWPQAFLGITFNFGVLMGYSAVTGTLSIEAVFLYIAAIAWTLGYDTIYALQDKDDDALIGIKSTARLFADNTQKWVTIFYLATIFILWAALILINAAIWSYLFLFFAGLYFYWQVQTLKLNDAANALERFKINRDVGLIICFIFLFA
ncbi:MAG: 4-hydroxybenzoate octaprenyltransferase [Pseudomonadota bacterium]